MQIDDVAKTTPVVTVDQYGNLVAGPNNGLASVLITSHEENGVNQSAVIAIKVRINVKRWCVDCYQLHTIHNLVELKLDKV